MELYSEVFLITVVLMGKESLLHLVVQSFAGVLILLNKYAEVLLPFM